MDKKEDLIKEEKKDPRRTISVEIKSVVFNSETGEIIEVKESGKTKKVERT